jgi:hypothetical protein
MKSEMSVVTPSTAVSDLMRSASTNVVVAAPYIKSLTLRSLLGRLPAGVSNLTCITRWLPEDIASGVCDIEIFEEIREYPYDGRLFVQPHLHAKYYRADEQCLIGSANITGRGLGWITPGNVELLVQLPFEFSGLGEWERALLRSAVLVTEELRDQILREAHRIKDIGVMTRVPEVDQGGEVEIASSRWIPSCPVPDRLWSVYTGGGLQTMVSSARIAAQQDLAALAPPNGLTQPLFTVFIAGILRQMPLMVEIDRLAGAGVTDTQAHLFLSASLEGQPPAYLIEHSWRVLKGWLMHFFPKTYRLEIGQEVLVKGEKLAR